MAQADSLLLQFQTFKNHLVNEVEGNLNKIAELVRSLPPDDKVKAADKAVRDISATVKSELQRLEYGSHVGFQKFTDALFNSGIGH